MNLREIYEMPPALEAWRADILDILILTYNIVCTLSPTPLIAMRRGTGRTYRCMQYSVATSAKRKEFMDRDTPRRTFSPFYIILMLIALALLSMY